MAPSGDVPMADLGRPSRRSYDRPVVGWEERVVVPSSSRKRTGKKQAAKTAAKKTAAKKPAQRRQAARGKGRHAGALVAPKKLASGLPSTVFAQASPRSLGGTSMLEMQAPITADSAMAFATEDGLVREAADRLRKAGFEVLALSRTTVNIAGPPTLCVALAGRQHLDREHGRWRGLARDAARHHRPSGVLQRRARG